MNVAIMQPCYLPWRGYFALMKLADVFVHLDDVELPLGRSYITRAAVKTAAGRHWLSLPVARRAHQLIAHAQIAGDAWRRKHVATLRQELPRGFDHVADLYDRPWDGLADLAISLAERIARALGLEPRTLRSASLGIPARSSRRILDLCRTLGATRYLTGHGGRNYLDHESFDAAGIDVMYLDYDLCPYPQPHGQFDPFVTALDVLAHAPDPLSHVHARLIPWRQFAPLTAA
jgi:hypothetical protein